MSLPITDPKVLDEPGRFIIVFRLTGELRNSKKKVEHASPLRSLREASVTMLRLIEARGYRASECLGAWVRHADPPEWPNTVAFLTYSGDLYYEDPVRP
jgi:hypothetical protein